MSDKRDDGGPAFPLARNEMMPYDPGMTLRDWFAGQALVGLMTQPNIGSVKYQERADWAYRQADAMLAERAKAQA